MAPKINYKSTGKRIELYMKLNDLSPKDVQEYIGLSCVQTVYHWIKGVSIPKLEHLYAFSALVNIDMDTLICGDREDYWEEDKVNKNKMIAQVLSED